MASDTHSLVRGKASTAVSVIPPNAFAGRSEKPDEEALSQALGPAKAVWDRFVAELAAEYNVNTQEWRCYSVKAGWSLRLKRGKRTIVWLAPCEGCFRVMFILGEKAVQAAHQSRLPERLLKMIDEAERHPEGRGLRIQVKAAKDIPSLKLLAEIKIEH